MTESKLALRIDDPTDPMELNKVHDLLAIYIEAARGMFEKRTGRTIHDTTLEVMLDAWPAERFIVLPRATPLIAIVSAKTKDSAAAETTWLATEYIADTDAMPGRLVLGYNMSWPSFTTYPVSPIRIRYRAGIATASPTPEAAGTIKTACLLLVGGMWENREAEMGDSVTVSTKVLKLFDQFISDNKLSYAF